MLTGDELGRYSDYELRAALPHLAVVARALPQDKTRLVRVSQEAGMVTGMTGDGVNDAPALKLADIGFSMGGGHGDRQGSRGYRPFEGGPFHHRPGVPLRQNDLP